MSHDRPDLPDRRAGSIVARVGGALVMLGASLFVMRPFLVPIVWAGMKTIWRYLNGA